MGEVLRTVFLVLFWGIIFSIQLNLDADTTATRKLKNALELAVHDATLSSFKLDKIPDGIFEFDQENARKTLYESLQENLYLDSSLAPTNQSFFQDKLEIKFIDFVDSTHPEIDEYPAVYTNDKYNIVDTINGPAIVVVAETKGPRYFTGEKNTIRQAVVYEYKFQSD